MKGARWRLILAILIFWVPCGSGARTPTVLFLPPDAMPQIIGVILPTSSVTCGETVSGEVIASSNVASVEVRVAGYSRSMQKIGPGRFTITVVVPQLPASFRRRTYILQVLAHNTRGDTVVRTVPITVR